MRKSPLARNFKAAMQKLDNLLEKMIPPSVRLPLYLFFLAFGSLISAIYFFSTPSTTKNIIFGYSTGKLIMIGGLFLLAVLLFWLALFFFRRPASSLKIWHTLFDTSGSGNIFFGIACAGVLLSWILLFLPSYKYPGNLSEYIERLRPILVWMLVSSIATTILFLFVRRQKSARPFLSNDGSIALTVIWVAIPLFLIGSVIIKTGIGLAHTEDYWYGAGVPVLWLQVLVSVCAGICIGMLNDKLPRLLKQDAVWFFFFWILAGWLWAKQPLQPNWFMPGTAGNNLFPFSDSALLDLKSQYALMGMGLNDLMYSERVIYPAFLTYLHAIFGQDVVLLMSAQAAVFAVLPALAYLLGSEIHSRPLGVAFASLLTFRGINAILSARWIDTASPKMILTDLPTAIALALLLVLMAKWIQSPQKITLIIFAGGALGMALMTRSHTILLIPIIITIVFMVGRFALRRSSLAVLLLICGMLVFILPWEIRNQSQGIPMFSSYYEHIRTIINLRYGYEPVISYDLPVSFDTPDLSQISRHNTSPLFSIKPAAEIQPQFVNSGQILNHFMHNVITSVLFLPASFVLDDLQSTVKEALPFWQQGWTGEGNLRGALLMLAANICLISLGIVDLIKRNSKIYLLLISIFLGYLAANSLSLTSGGRYVVPVDWIILAFYLIGLLFLGNWFLARAGFSHAYPPYPHAIEASSATNVLPFKPLSPIISSVVMVFFAGSLAPLSEHLYRNPFSETSKTDMVLKLEQQDFFQMSGISKNDLSQFLLNPDAVIYEGRLFYPRYYESGVGEADRQSFYSSFEWNRLVFTLTTPSLEGPRGVFLYGEDRWSLENASDIILIGCDTRHFVDALYVVSLGGSGEFYPRQPILNLSCPLKFNNK